MNILIIDLNNDTLPVGETISNVRETTTKNEVFNIYNLLEIPLLLGYENNFGKGRLGVSMGIGINIHLKTKGQIINLDGQLEDTKTLIAFKNNVGLSFIASIKYERFLNQHFSIGVSPFVKHYTQSFTHKDYGLKQNYTLYGVNAGVKYTF